MSIVCALFIFSVIILFHEFGHFLLAKKNGITVVEFSLGMGSRILSREWRGTRYSWKILPFGGSCMMLGEDEEDQGEGTFGSKSVWARISVIAAGPVFNFILAFVASVLIIASFGYDPPKIRSVSEGSPAEAAGFLPGDVIHEINGRKIHIARDIRSYLSFHPGKELTIVWERDGEIHTSVVRPELNEQGQYKIGLLPGVGYVKGNAWETVKYSVYEVRYWIDMTLQSLKMLGKGQVGIEDMSGPVGVVSMIGETYTESAKSGAYAIWINMLNICILLSANLGVMNLLPIPALDGGRLVFLVLEAIRGKRIPPEKEGMVNFAGLMLLMMLMVVVMFNDVMKLL